MGPKQQRAFRVYRAFVPNCFLDEGKPFYFLLYSKELFLDFVTFLENSEDSETAARLVGRLEIQDEDWCADEQDATRLARCLPKMVNLSTLTLKTPGFNHPAIIAALCSSGLPSLETLHLNMDDLDTKDISILRGVVPKPGSLKDVRFLSDKDSSTSTHLTEDYPQEYTDAVMRLLAASSETIETLIVRSLLTTKAFARTSVRLQFPNLSVLKTFGHWFKQSQLSLAQPHPKVTHLEFWVPDESPDPDCSCSCDVELLRLLGRCFPSLKELAFEALDWPHLYPERLEYFFTEFLQQTKYLERATLSLVVLKVPVSPDIKVLHEQEQAALMRWATPSQLPNLVDVALSPARYSLYLHVLLRDKGEWKPQDVRMLWPNNSDVVEACRIVRAR
ncbi:hypothetical protein EIP86_009351 [Pleurotus ostreatoroseus]|nr:hypothetical protein EIP86_009351 [Pleurotus ostreatoroseus]